MLVQQNTNTLGQGHFPKATTKREQQPLAGVFSWFADVFILGNNMGDEEGLWIPFRILLYDRRTAVDLHIA